MKKLRYILLLFLCFYQLDVFADEVEKCTSGEMSRLRELANNVKFNVDYEFMGIDEEYGTVNLEYKIEILNFSNDLKISYKDNAGGNTGTLTSNQTIIDGLDPRRKMFFSIYAYTDNLCTGSLLKGVTVDLPAYNEYYYFHKEKCNEYPDFKYCKEFMNIGGKEFDEIDKLFDEYLEVKNQKPKNNDFNKVYWYIGGGVLIIMIIAVVIILRKYKLSKEDI